MFQEERTRKHLPILLATSSLILGSATAQAGEFTDAFVGGKPYADLRLRWENVAQDNALEDADAVTLRTRLGYVTGKAHGFSARLEFEDSRALVDDYNDGLGSRPEFSTVADPETTELDQAYIKYDNDRFDATLGRQIITYDNQRYVGHVGWRQDRQTFDGLDGGLLAGENFEARYSYIDQRNRIFAEERDVDSNDHLFNLGYNTPAGKLTGYAYLLEEDNASKQSIDSYGVRFSGGREYENSESTFSAEFATQENSAVGQADFEADYYLLEAGITARGLTGKLGYEVLGSDNGQYGYSTPLATLHAFNGWTDQFLTTPDQGLVDLYFSLGGALAGGKWLVVFHDFEADESTPGVSDLGSEIGLSYTRKFADYYTAGVKYASYSAGDINVDTDKFWLWLEAGF